MKIVRQVVNRVQYTGKILENTVHIQKKIKVREEKMDLNINNKKASMRINWNDDQLMWSKIKAENADMSLQT